MKAIKVFELAAACNKLVKEGNGDKKILISRDDEGNCYHELFFGFSEEYKPDDNLLPYGVNQKNIKDYIVLG